MSAPHPIPPPSKRRWLDKYCELLGEAGVLELAGELIRVQEGGRNWGAAGRGEAHSGNTADERGINGSGGTRNTQGGGTEVGWGARTGKGVGED